MIFKLRGNIYKATFPIVKKVMSSFFMGNSLAVKERVFGEEIKVLDSDIEFYCYSSLENRWEDAEENFIIDAFLKLEEVEMKKFITALVDSFDSCELIYELEWQIEDENGDSLSEEFVIRAPGYYPFMEKYYGF